MQPSRKGSTPPPKRVEEFRLPLLDTALVSDIEGYQCSREDSGHLVRNSIRSPSPRGIPRMEFRYHTRLRKADSTLGTASAAHLQEL